MKWFDFVFVEGKLETHVVKRMFREFSMSYRALKDMKGRGNLWREVGRYNQAAKQLLIFGLADLETEPCASGLLARCLPEGRQANLILRLAKPMLEAWLLADGKRMARFLGVSDGLISKKPEQLQHPKYEIIRLAEESSNPGIRRDFLPDPGWTVGRGYTQRMQQFVEQYWNPREAQNNSPSLKKALAALQEVAVR